MAEPITVLQTEFSALTIARTEFPIWTTWGVEDESTAIHSLGQTYLTTVGQRAGFVGCCEYPVAGPKVRADSVWWDRDRRVPVAAFEFERHKGGDELKRKVRNLLRAYHGLGGRPSLLGLVFWTKNFYPLSDESLRELWRIFQTGFEDEERAHIPPAPLSLLRIFECLHSDAGPGRHTLKEITERRRA